MATKRARIEELAEELAALSPEDRNLVVAAAFRRGPKPAHEGQKASAWQRLHAVEGMVSLGGNALDDCAKLYDG